MQSAPKSKVSGRKPQREVATTVYVRQSLGDVFTSGNAEDSVPLAAFRIIDEHIAVNGEGNYTFDAHGLTFNIDAKVSE